MVNKATKTMSIKVMLMKTDGHANIHKYIYKFDINASSNGFNTYFDSVIDEPRLLFEN